MEIKVNVHYFTYYSLVQTIKARYLILTMSLEILFSEMLQQNALGFGVIYMEDNLLSIYIFK